MSLSMVGKYILLTIEIQKLNILSAMEYRTSFLLQVIGMIVNNTGLVLVWVIFFKRFNNVNGWTFQDTTLMFAISTMVYAIVMIFSRGAYELSRTINLGELDYYLVLPKNIMWNASVSKTSISAIGDLIFSLLIFLFSGEISINKIVLFLSVSVLASIILYSFIIITQSISFFVTNFEDAAAQFFDCLMGFTLYPQTVFHGLLKILMLTVFPAFFMIALPIQIVKNFNIYDLAILFVVAITLFFISKFAFEKGLKRYESGNLMNVRL